MLASTAVDDFELPWPHFGDFFLSPGDDDRTFLIELNHTDGTRRSWTVGEWKRTVLSAVITLQKHGVCAGGAVAALAGNSANALALAYASWVMGACYVPLNPGDSSETNGFILRDADVRVLVHSEANRALVEMIDLAPSANLVSATNFAASWDAHDYASAVDSDVGLDTPALRVYTSGTTGRPKGVVLSARNLLTDCDGLHQALAWPADTRIITVLPVHHVNGLVISSLLPWYSGHSTILCDRFRSDRFWHDVWLEGATVSSMVPSLLEFLLQSGGTPPAGFREVLCGAGPLLPDTAIEFEETFELPVRHLYGLSETTAVVTLTPRMDREQRRRWHRTYGTPSIGPAIPHVELEIHDDDGKTCAEGDRGELVMRGAVVMQGYAELPEDTAEAFRDGWFHSGDQGFWVRSASAPPYFFVTGRIKELIIRGGVNISPVEVDSVLRRHPAIRFGLAIPFENRFYGEEIAAYVVADSDVSDEDILAHCARYLDYARQPKVIVRGEDIPFTATGKPKRIELRERLATTLSVYRDVQFRRSANERPTQTGEHAVGSAPVRAASGIDQRR